MRAGRPTSAMAKPNVAPATKSDIPRSPNIAPATKSHATICEKNRMTRHVHWRPIRALKAYFVLENTTLCAPYLTKCLQILLLPRKVTLQHHQKWRSQITNQMLRLPRKVTLQHHQIVHPPWKVTLRHHQMMRLPPKVKLQHHQILHLPPKATRQIAWGVIYIGGRFENDPTMIRAGSGHLAPAEVTSRFGDAFCIGKNNILGSGYLAKFHKCCSLLLRLRKVTFQHHQTLRLPQKWRSQITKCCVCHEKWHCNITKCCPCLEKWHSNITKRCPCHEKWMMWVMCVMCDVSDVVRCDVWCEWCEWCGEMWWC